MELQNIVRSQFHASPEMLRQAIEKCPEALWNHQILAYRLSCSLLRSLVLAEESR